MDEERIMSVNDPMDGERMENWSCKSLAPIMSQDEWELVNPGSTEK